MTTAVRVPNAKCAVAHRSARTCEGGPSAKSAAARQSVNMDASGLNAKSAVADRSARTGEGGLSADSAAARQSVNMDASTTRADSAAARQSVTTAGTDIAARIVEARRSAPTVVGAHNAKSVDVVYSSVFFDVFYCCISIFISAFIARGSMTSTFHKTLAKV